MIGSMCGRAYETYTEEELELRYTTKKRRSGFAKINPNYNLCPTQNSPVILYREGIKAIESFRWGLVPHWAADLKTASKYSLINARSESILEKRTYATAFKFRRCIVPFSGFFEWKRTSDTKKTPFLIQLKNESIMSVAGIWEHWKPDTKDEVFSFSILTVGANSLIEKIHHRMPFILSAEQEEVWLNPEESDVETLKKLAAPFPTRAMEMFEISARVNSPKNNSPENLKPII